MVQCIISGVATATLARSQGMRKTQSLLGFSYRMHSSAPRAGV